MTVSTNTSAQCPRCQVRRAPLPEGGWCETCGWNPAYEAQLQDLRSALAAQVLRCPTVQYGGMNQDADGSPYVWLRLGRDEWDRWVRTGAPPVPMPNPPSASNAQNAVCPYCFGPFDGQHEAAVVGDIHIIACPLHPRWLITGLPARKLSAT